MMGGSEVNEFVVSNKFNQKLFYLLPILHGKLLEKMEQQLAKDCFNSMSSFCISQDYNFQTNVNCGLPTTAMI